MDILIEEYKGTFWTAALKQGRLEGFEVDSSYEEVRWGSIYWAQVKSINPAIDAVFLDLDGDNMGVLYNQDVRIKTEDGQYIKGGDKAIGKVFSPGDMVAVQAKSAYIPNKWDEYTRLENKSPQMSMDITMPGRHLIHSAADSTNNISSRIHNKAMRAQLASMLDDLDDMTGFILRASAANTQTDVLRREAKILKEAWDQMSAFFKNDTPSLIMMGPDAVQRTLSDQAGQVIERIEVVTMNHLNHVEEWCSIFAPDLVPKIIPVEIDGAEEDLALFHERDIIGQIEDLSEPYVMLKDGGNVIVQETAALTAIDVNKGADKGSNLSTNLQAAHDIARQMRLRNTGGIIIIDFLKFQGKDNEKRVLDTLKDLAFDDPCTIQVHGTTRLGLVELTRKRRTPPLEERLGTNFKETL